MKRAYTKQVKYDRSIGSRNTFENKELIPNLFDEIIVKNDPELSK